MADKKFKQTDVSRRDVFHILGAVPVAAAIPIPAIAEAAHDPTPAAAPYKRLVFDDRQWKTVGRLADIIIPADEVSGSATDAGVPEFLDDWLAFQTDMHDNDRLKAEILGGLTWLDRESNRLFSADFADASADQQKQIVDRIAWSARTAPEDHLWAEFFSSFRNLVVSGFYSSKIGVKDLPYLGNRAIAEWRGCDPKVWSVIEERMRNGYTGLVKGNAASG
jgi:gluconate 2-dehydrogenase gamma chain